MTKTVKILINLGERAKSISAIVEKLRVARIILAMKNLRRKRRRKKRKVKNIDTKL